MAEWILILVAYAGPLSNTDSVALTNVPGWRDEASCAAVAGKLAASLTERSTKVTRFVCVKQEPQK